MNIALNIAARRAAEEAIELAVMASESVENKPRFWEAIAKFACEQCGHCMIRPEEVPAAIVPMTDDERRSFERQGMPFGQFAGTPIKDVRLSYLMWLANQQDEFSTMLKRYLKNESVDREIESS